MTTTERAKLRAMEAILNPKPTRTGPTQPHLHLTARSVRGRPAMTTTTEQTESPALEPMANATYYATHLAEALARLNEQEPDDVLACSPGELRSLVRALQVVRDETQEWLEVLPL